MMLLMLSQRKSVIFRALLILCLVWGVKPALAAVTISETFKKSTAPGWVFGGSALLTSGNIDPVNQGWLRLTPETGSNKFGYVYYDTSYRAPFGFSLEFQFGAWGGSGADGFTVFLFNGSNTVFNIGDYGGSLGYANGCAAPGLSDAILGVAFDEFGNFSHTDRCKIDGVGRQPNSVTLRGPVRTNYNYITHNQLSKTTDRLDCPKTLSGCLAPARPPPSFYYRQAKVLLIPDGCRYSATVLMRKSATSDYEVIIPSIAIPEPICSEIKVGFAASTGGVNNAHEIRNLQIDVFESETDLSITGGFVYSLFKGKTTEFRANITNNGPNADTGPTEVEVALPPGLTYSGQLDSSWWSCTSSGQIVTCTHPGQFLANSTLPLLRLGVNVSSAVGGQTLITTASVSGVAFDTVPANNTVTTARYVFGVTAKGTKNLYAYFANSGTGGTPLTSPPGTANTLQRKQPGSGLPSMPQSNTGILTGAGSATGWITLTPSLINDVVLPSGNDVEVLLCIRRFNSTEMSRDVRVEIRRENIAGTLGETRNLTIADSGSAIMAAFGIPLTSDWTLTASNPLQMRIINTSPTTNREIRVYSNTTGCAAGDYSRADFYTNTVVNVDEVEVHSSVYPDDDPITHSEDNSATVYARSVVSDPFGSFDISGALFEMYDKDNNLVAGPAAMTQVNDNVSLGQKTYQLGFTVPPWPGSSYVLKVTGQEGVEGAVTHSDVTDFIVEPAFPSLSITKLASSASADPGSTVSYTVQVSNTGSGNATNVVFTDPIPNFTLLDYNKYGSLLPVMFVDGDPSSTLTMGTVRFSKDDGANWNYIPISMGGGAPVGFDSLITNIRIPMIGVLPPGRSFTLHYDVQVE